MANPQPITYTPQFQPPSWQDNVDLVAAAGPNGFNVQFQNLRVELDALSTILAQLSATISTFTQTLNSTQLTAQSALNASNTATATASSANTAATNALNAANTANTAATNALNAANAAATAAKQKPIVTVNVTNRGGYTAWCNVDYTDANGQSQHLDGGRHFPVGDTLTIPTTPGPSNVRVSCGADWGSTIFNVTLPDPITQNITKNVNIYGTTLIHWYDGI